jgi:hypothetical protein
VAAAVHTHLVDEGAVAGEAVVDQGALAAHDVDLGVQARHLLVPTQAHVGGLATAHPQLLGARLDRHDRLLVGAVAEDQEGAAGAKAGDPRSRGGHMDAWTPV